MRRIRDDFFGKLLFKVNSKDTKAMPIDVVVAFISLTLERCFPTFYNQKSCNNLLHSTICSKKQKNFVLKNTHIQRYVTFWEKLNRKKIIFLYHLTLS